MTNIAQYAFSGASGAGLTGGVLRLDRLQTLGMYAFEQAKFDAMLIGYDNLSAMEEKAMTRATADTMVIGSGPRPVSLGASAIAASTHHLWFRGQVPETVAGSIQMEGTYLTTIFIRADEPGWADLPVREATADEKRIFREKNPGVSDDRLIGVLAQDALGNVRPAFLAYGDYRTEENRLFIEVDARYAAQCPVVPALGMHAADYPAGTKVVLAAPADAVQVGDIKVKAVKYIVSELDDYGRWTKNVTTNDYVVGSENAVTMPAKGSLRVEWIFDEAYSVRLAPRLTEWYPEQVTYLGEDVPEELWIAKGGTCTFVARVETDGQPKTRFLRWEGDIGDAAPENPTLTLTVTDAVKVKAVFAHDWYIDKADLAVSGDATMTDGNWTLKIRRQSDLEGRRRIKVGRSYDNTAIVEGSGPMDLSTQVSDAAGNGYYIHLIEYNAFRPGSSGNPAQNACTDFTAPTNLVELGQCIFYAANTALTNVTLNCPELTTMSSQPFMGCAKLQRVYFNAPKLTKITNSDFWSGVFCDCSALVDVYLNLPLVEQLPTKFVDGAPLTATDCANWHLDSVTNVCDAFMGYKGSAHPGPYGELRLPKLESLTGSRQFAERYGITKLVLGSGKLRLLGSQGGAASNPDSQKMCRPENAFLNMKGLRHIELGLAPDAEIPDGIFPGLGLDKVTNLTFTAAPPSNTNIFAAVAKATTVPADGTKTVKVWADWDNPGWGLYNGEFAATAAALGILGYADLTDEEKAAHAALPRQERKRWMGLVYDKKRFGWLLHYGNVARGLVLFVR